MFDSPSKPSTAAYRDNWERIYMPANPCSSEDVQLAKRLSEMPVILHPTMNQDEMVFVSSSGTAYKITNIGVAPE
jgi:hypothetical protein